MVKFKACLASALFPGTMRNISLLGRTVLIINVDGRILAIDGICPNDGGNLAEGALKGFIVKCPLDGSEFDLRTGKLVKEPWGTPTKKQDLRSYVVTLENGCIYIDV
jgi:nitrite reductase/ring-hydroxylating ferredoxin subunit